MKGRGSGPENKNAGFYFCAISLTDVERERERRKGRKEYIVED